MYAQSIHEVIKEQVDKEQMLASGTTSPLKEGGIQVQQQQG